MRVQLKRGNHTNSNTIGRVTAVVFCRWGEKLKILVYLGEQKQAN